MSVSGSLRIGIVAVQGGFSVHASALGRAGYLTQLVRVPGQLQGLSGLVLPGGESSTQLKLLTESGLDEAIKSFANTRPVLGTCAGAILMAQGVSDPVQSSFGLIDIDVQRNGFGRQLDSFEGSSDGGAPLVFIRAPRITRVGGEVEVVDSLKGEAILVKDGSHWAATFHPELTDNVDIYGRVFGPADHKNT